MYNNNTSNTNTTITGLSPINEYYTVTIIPVNVIGYGPSVTVNGMSLLCNYCFIPILILVSITTSLSSLPSS